MAKSKWIIILFLSVFVFQAHAEDNTGKKDLKDIYTAITNKVNSAMLTRRGSNEIEGSASFQSVRTEYDKGLKITERLLNADFGYGRFVFNNLSLGILLSVRNQSVTNEITDVKKSTNQIWIGPSLKKYFGRDKVRPFVSAQYLLLRGDIFEGGEADLGAGLMIHVAGNMGLILQARYGFLTTDDETVNSRNRLLLAAGMIHFTL